MFSRYLPTLRKMLAIFSAYQCIGRCCLSTRIAGGGLFSGSFCGSFTPPLSLGVCDLAKNSAKFKIISSFWLIFWGPSYSASNISSIFLMLLSSHLQWCRCRGFAWCRRKVMNMAPQGGEMSMGMFYFLILSWLSMRCLIHSALYPSHPWRRSLAFSAMSMQGFMDL